GDAVAKLVEGGKASFAGPEIKGKRLGVVGLGAVGVMVANDARSLGMNVMGYDPYISVEHAWGLSRQIHRETSLEMLVAESDYISIHVPLGEKTKKMFDAQLLEYAKPGCVIMNFSRSELVCTQAMIDQLQSGRVGRYVTDFPVDELLDVEGVIAIPHLGASTPESEENCAAMAAEELNEYLLSGNIHNSVNFPDVVLPRTSSHRIAMIHANISNMVGQITALLATDKHNISDMINKSRGEMAYTIIDTDHDISAELLEKIQSVEGMVRVRCLGREHAAF
ncbi:MAG: phosphoglycerate dehydrogenase, partial [Christensenellales bacterium]